jgi:nucleoside-diphosphate-sugar epimerase
LARVLIVGCGCRGRALAAALAADGLAVRGTTRSEGSLDEIDAAGAEAVVADPDHLTTLLPRLAGVSVVCWLMGSAAAEDLHGPRLQSLIDRLVDTPVRGVVYEAAGAADPAVLERGAAIVRAAATTYRMPAEVVDSHPAGHDEWLAAMRAAVGRVLLDDA